MLLSCSTWAYCQESRSEAKSYHYFFKYNLNRHHLAFEIQALNSYLIDIHQDKFKKSSTKKYKSSTNSLQLLMEEEATVLTFVQYNY